MDRQPETHGIGPDAPIGEQPLVNRLGSPGQIVKMLQARLMPQARERTVQRAVAGGRFCAVVLDDGGVGAVNICRAVCGEPLQRMEEVLPEPGTSAANALADWTPPEQSAVGLATANALANRSIRDGGPGDDARIGGDLLDVLELEPQDHVGMVGCFTPLVEGLRRQVHQLSIFERTPRLVPGLLPEDQAPEKLSACSVALITATTLMNGTIDALLAATCHCREVVLLGPSTPLVPEVFADPPRRVTILAGAVVTDPERLLQIVSRDGGTRDFKSSMAKVNVRVAKAR